MSRLPIFCLSVVLVSFVCGCRTTDPRSAREISMLRSEVVDWEDQYFSLKSKHRRTVNELRKLKGLPELVEEPGFFDSSSETIYIDDGQYFEETVPTLQSTPSPKENRELIPAPTPQESRQERASILKAVSANGTVTKIQINRSSTYGHDVDGQPGDEGLVVLVQPMTTTGTIVQQPGKLTISVIDPLEIGPAQRIGLWKFSFDDVQKFFIKEEFLDQGILLHLPWDLKIPRNRRLQIHARFTTREGVVLESSIELGIAPPANGHTPDENLVAQWIENDDRWIDAFGASIQKQPSERLLRGTGPSFRKSPDSSNRRKSQSRWRPKR